MNPETKVLIFHPTIAPYRIAFFNRLYSSFQTRICLYFKDLPDNTFDYDRLSRQFVFRPDFFSRSKKIFGRTFYLGHIREIDRYQPDIVIVGEYGEGLMAAVFYRLFHRKKYKIISICDDSLKIAEECKGLRKISRNLLLKQTDGLILCNGDVQDWYRTNLQFNRSFVFPIIQDETEFDRHYQEKHAIAQSIIQDYSLTGKRVFLFVGRLAPEKNIGYLIDSFLQQHEAHPENILFMIGGDCAKAPDLRSRLEKQIENSNAGDYIRFIGRLEGTELLSWFLAAQVLVLPSYYEPFGAVVNEALLSGEYVMVSDRAGAACLVDSQNGEIIDIARPSINFENVCEKTEPIPADWHPHKSRMSFTFSEKMDGLLEWIEALTKDSASN